MTARITAKMIKGMRPLLVLLLLLPATLAASDSTGAEVLEEIRSVQFDPEQSYRVRDLFLEREDVKLYFTDGQLLFAEPAQGRTIAALFIATSPTDQGEILVIPPTAGERQSVARFTSQPVLNEKFRTAMMFFTDDTAEQLRQAVEDSYASNPDPDEGAALAKRWNSVLRNLLEGTSMRILFDLISSRPPASGFFAAVVGGSRFGRFDVVVDPHHQRQVVLGQSVWRDDRHYFETWCSFPGRTFRNGEREALTTPGRLENYRIESHLAPDLLLDVAATATFVPETTTQRAFALELSERLFVDKLLLDGEPVEFLQLEQPISSDVRRRQNNLIMMVLPENPPEGARFELEMHYQGRVVSEAEEGIYYVGSRGTWYPKAGADFTDFDLTFHYPAALDLVATGDLEETSVEGNVRTSRFRTGAPIRLAGFNLGRYLRTSQKAGEYAVEVCANQQVESSLRPQPQSSVIFLDPSARRGRGYGPVSPGAVITPTPPEQVRPADRIDGVAASSVDAVNRMAEWFGAPATRRIVISPVPRNFGQGFPGLVYVSTLSYFRADDPPLKDMPPEQQLFYTDLLLAHEISHQWWGNVITVTDEADIWLMESLATYSSLMLLEERRGPEARDNILALYKQQLLEVNEDGDTTESAGPVVLGYRLRSSKFPNAPNVIMYQKGAWIIHMLRNIMGDESFRNFLRDLLARYQFQPINTDQFRQEATAYLPKDWHDPKLEVFFDQWVYGTGIPKYELTYRTKGKAPQIRFQAKLRQDNVPDHFTAAVPVLIETLPGLSTLEQIRTDGRETELNIVLRNPPSNVVVNPGKSVLAVVE